MGQVHILKSLSAEEFAALCGGNYVGPPGIRIGGFATDSRTVKGNDLFIAISGERVDGHEFADSAVASGAVAVLSERPLHLPHILVSNIVDALANFGSAMRRRFDGPVVGITGSAGKTTTKEFLAAALGEPESVLKSEGNRNTEYTSPLIWAELTEQTRFAVIEMAMRGFGQITHLAQIAKPQTAIITNIGHSHLQQVGSRAGIAKAKGELIQSLPENGLSILWQEDEFLSNLDEVVGSRPRMTFGFSPTADCRLEQYELRSWNSAHLVGSCRGEAWELDISAIGRHIALDAAAAILCATHLGISAQHAANRISKVKLPPMRMEVRTINNATVLLDSYNASPASMLSAIETVCDMPVSGRRLAILGQMLELGDATDDSHQRVGEAVQESKIDQVAFVGPAMKRAFAVVGTGRSSWSETSAPCSWIIDSLGEGDVLLIKGSRALELEKLLPG